MPLDDSGTGDAGHASGRLHSTLLKHLAGAVYRCRNDAEWTVEFISDGCLTLTGYRADELTGNRVVSLGALMHPEDAARVWEKCQANLTAHQPCSSEYRIRHRGGGERWVWDQAQGIYTDTGELLFIEGLLTDITAQKQAETQALTFAALGRQLNGAVSARAAGEIVLDAAQRLFGWDAATVDLYYAATDTVESVLNRDTLAGRRLDVAPSLPGGPPTARARRVLREGAQLILRAPPFAFQEGDVPSGDTSRPSAAIMAVPVRQETSVVGLLSIQSYTPQAYTRADLDTLQALADYCGGAFHRLQTREALRVSDERLRLAVHAANVGLWDWDLGTNQVIISREWKSQLGYAEEEIGNTFSEWESRVHPDDLAPTLARVRRALAAGEAAYEVEFRMRHKDGSWRWIYTRAEVFRDAQGRAARVIGCHVDVTGRKQTERRQAAFAALGRRLNEATDEAGAARIIVDIADDLFSWDSCKLDLYDAQSDRCRSILTMDVVNGQRQEVPPAYADTPPSPRLRRSLEGVAELILREPPLALTPDRMPFGDVSRPSASLLSVPLREGGHVVGVLAIQSYRLHAYTHDDLAALQALADHCAGALERVRSRAEVERQRNELALILDTVPGLIFYKDRAHRLVRVNEAHARSLGLTRPAIEGRTDAELGSPFVEGYLRDDEEVMRTGQPRLGIIEPLQTPAGTRWLQTDKLPYRDADGNVIGVLGFALDITERRQAEGDLRASEERLRLATQAAGIGAFEWDAQTGVNVWTPKLEALHGLRPGEFPGTQPAWEQMVHPEDRARVVALVQHAFETLSPQAGEWRVIWPDGSVHWLAGRFQAFNDEAGVPRRLIGANHDITARKQAEAALRVAEAKYHSIFQHAVEGIYQSTADGHYLTINPAMARIYGYASAEEMLEEVTDIGRQLYVDPEDRRRVQALLHAQGGTGVFECQMRRRDGALVWIRQSARVVRDGRGRVLCYEGSVEDITERRQAEERLRHQHALLTAVVEGTTDAVFIKDLAGRYQLINAAGARAIGRTAEEILGRTDAELLPPETASRFRAVDEAVAATGTTQVQEESGFMAGKLSHWHANKAPWRDADGRIQGVIGVSRDITEHRRAEAARREAEVRFRTLFERAPVGVVVLDPATARVLECNEQAARQLGYTIQEFTGLAIPDFEAVETDSQTREHIAQILRTGRDTFETRHRTKTGEVRDVLVTTQTLELAGRAVFHCIFLDITERRQAKELLALRARQQAVVADLGLLALAAPDLQPLFDQAVARVAETFGVEFCKVLELLPERNAVRLVAGVGWNAGLVGHATVGVDHDSQAGHTLLTKEPVIVEELRTDPRFNGPALLREHNVVSGLSVIIGHAEQPVGVLGVHSTRRRGFTPDDVSFLQAVANVLAEAIRRRQVEQAMRESEAALVRAQAVAHLGSWRLDVARNRLTWSAEAHRIFGVPEGTPMDYEFFLARVHPEDRPQVDDAWQAALAGAPYDLEHRILVEDEVKWVREQAVLEFDAAGRLVGGLGTVQDITGLKRTEQRLAAFASLGRGLNAAHEVREAARLIVGVADELFGWEACFVDLYDPAGEPVPVLAMDTMEGRKLEVSVVPRERPTPGPASRIIEAGELILRDPAEEEERFVPFGDTGRRSASLLFVPLRLHGRTTGLLSIQSYRPLAYNRETLATLQALADYTALSLERLLAQEALRESEARYRTLFAHSPQPMWVFDPVTLGFLEVNEAAVLLYGFTREEFLAMKTTDLRPPEERERHLQSLMLDAPGVRDLGVWRHWKKDRTALWVQVFAHAVEFAGGRAELVLVHDVTAQLAAEAEVVQLSGRLLRAQDEERRRLARELHDSTAQTFAALAMNLAVLGRITPGMDDASRALLAECEIQVRRGTAELRTLAYLLHPPALEALGLTRAIHDYAEGFARRSGVRVELDVAELPDRLPPETELTLFRVLQESLGNVHRHSGSATAAIRLAQDAETVVIEVRDTGCGLGAAEQAAATSGSARFGVGIAGMRERLRLLGGRLEVEPALPGVRVRATLPLTAAADE